MTTELAYLAGWLLFGIPVLLFVLWMRDEIRRQDRRRLR